MNSLQRRTLLFGGLIFLGSLWFTSPLVIAISEDADGRIVGIGLSDFTIPAVILLLTILAYFESRDRPKDRTERANDDGTPPAPIA